MDPDMVRQQEEAEFEQRMRGLAIPRSEAPKTSPAGETVFARTPESRIIRVSVKAPAPELEQRAPHPRWHVYMRTAFESTALAGLGVLAGMAFGASHGLAIAGQLWLGGGAGLFMSALYAALPSRGTRLRPVSD